MKNIEYFYLWMIFIIMIIIIFIYDIKYQKNPFHSKKQLFKQSLLMSIIWIIITLIFNFLYWLYLLFTKNLIIANHQALIFLTGFILEKNLTMDNIFIWYIILNYFSIPFFLQRWLLTCGIIGAIIFRVIFIIFGNILITKFRWLLIIFSPFLIGSGLKILLEKNRNKLNVNKPKILNILNKYLPITQNLSKTNTKLIIFEKNKLFITPFFLALICIEISDLIFSFDSIPAIFSVTNDLFIILTTNLFSLFGLRSMYLLFSNLIESFLFIKYAIAIILIFIGIKLLISFYIKISIILTLNIIISILLLTFIINKLKLFK